jgi:predicted ATPase
LKEFEMLRALQLRNFKSVRESTVLELGKLNILSGTNSSGKSTLIQSILLIAQTLLSNDERQPLAFNGPLIALGTPSDVWHNGQLSEPLEIMFLLRRADQNKDVLYEMAFETTQDGARTESTPVVRLREGYYATSPLDQDEYSGIRYIHGQLPQLDPKFEEKVRSALGAGKIDEDDPLKMRAFLPSAFRQFIEKAEMDAWQNRFLKLFTYEEEASDKEIPEKYADQIARLAADLKLRKFESRVRSGGLFSRQQRLPKFENYVNWARQLTAGDLDTFIVALEREFEEAQKRQTESGELSVELSFRDFEPRELTVFEETAQELFTARIRYLSANRAGPTALFRLSEADPISEVGINGQNLAEALSQYGQAQLVYWSPTRKEDVQASLQAAVADWLQYMGLIQRYELVDYNKLGLLLQVFVEGVSRPLDLSSVGFGTSQVLPILVQGLLTPEGGLFIVEQPEVHLHPKLQSHLAYFFYSLARRNVQCIVETHSDHIVNQLRVLVAKMSRLRQDVRIYFASRSPAEGTRFEEVRMKEGGAIENWPQDFLSEAEKLARELVKTALAK